MSQKNKYIVRDDSMISSKFLSSNIKNYQQLSTMHGLKQLIKSPTQVTCGTSTVMIIFKQVSLLKFLRKVSSDYQLFFWTRKISRLKTGGIHKYLNFHSFKNYTVDSCNETIKQLEGRLLQFISENNIVIEKITPYRNK